MKDRRRSANDTCAKSVRWLVSGRVQGVGFRWFVRQAATAHGVRGDVKNLRDGSVEVRAVGPDAALDRLLAELREGPRGAQVDAVVSSAWDDGGVEPGFRVLG